MTVTDDQTDLFARLTTRECDILRLLASGHTAKTIAAQLGCSETSVNERLRDARRKTGVGSSRELARLLIARKNWDKNIGLSAAAPVNDDERQPTPSVRGEPKGRIVMLLLIPIVTAGLALFASQALHTASPSSAADKSGAAGVSQMSPLAGTWSLDTSRIPEEERPRSVTITFRVASDRQWTTIVDIVAPDGSRQHAESTATVDGEAVPVTGNMAAIDTGAIRQPGPNTLVLTLGKNGAPVSTRVYTVAKDRKSMTETIIWPSDHLSKLETTYFKRTA